MSANCGGGGDKSVATVDWWRRSFEPLAAAANAAVAAKANAGALAAAVAVAAPGARDRASIGS